jgi:agmatine deiminase
MPEKAKRGERDLSAVSEGSPRALGYRMPAEWEPHAATWLAWPHQEKDWPGKFAPVPWVFVEIARKLASAERVRLIVADRAMAKHARAALVRAGVDVQQVDFLQARTNRSWTRDFVPSFVVSGKGQRPRRASALGARARDGVAAVKFRFNGWARYPNHREDEAAGQRVAEWVGVPAFEPSARVGNRPRRVVLEGGAIDVDGQGTLLTTEECLLDGRQARNPELGRAGSEQMLSAELGIDKVLWLERGIAGDDTGGHIDDFARFVAPATVVLAKEPRNRDPNHRVLEAARSFACRCRARSGSTANGCQRATPTSTSATRACSCRPSTIHKTGWRSGSSPNCFRRDRWWAFTRSTWCSGSAPFTAARSKSRASSAYANELVETHALGR